jgi:hypothetical protein
MFISSQKQGGRMKGQGNIFGVFIGGSILLLVVGMILALTYMFIAQTDSVVSGLNTTISSATAIFAGVNGTPYALAHNPISFSAFGISNYDTKTNETTLMNNGSRLVYLNSTFYTTPQANLTVCYNNQNNSSTTIKLNGVTLGNVTAYAVNCAVFASQQSNLVATNNITMVVNNASFVFTNASIKYAFFNTTALYTVAGDEITPLANGTFRATYNYASAGVDTDNAIAALDNVTDAIDLFPQWLVMVVFGTIMVGLLGLVIGIVVFVKQGGLIGGGLQ